MEERLKRERNRLFLRIILILLAVWLTVSACSKSVMLWYSLSLRERRML